MTEVTRALLDLARKLCKYAHSSKCTIKMAYQMINGAHKYRFFQNPQRRSLHRDSCYEAKMTQGFVLHG